MAEEQEMPLWVEDLPLQPVLQNIIPNFQQIKEFNVKKSWCSGEIYNSLVLKLDSEVELDDESSKTVSLILKTAQDNEMCRMVMEVNNIFEVETIMYKEIIPVFEELYREAGVEVKFGPKYYELETEYPNILLEDLCEKGFKIYNQVGGYDAEHTKAVLKKLAQWHAASAVYVTSKGEFNQLIAEGSYKEEMREIMESMFGDMYPTFLTITKAFEEDEEYFEDLCRTQENLIDEILESTKINPTEFNVLNHGDCWWNNIMFQHDAFDEIRETYFIDFQMPKYGSPAQDLYNFLLSSTEYDIKVRRFDCFIKYYHKKLEEHLTLLNYTNGIPSLRDIHIMLYKYGVWGYTTATTTMAKALLDPHDKTGFENFDLDFEEDIKSKIELYANLRYRHHMKLVLPWLYNRGILGVKQVN